MTITRVDIQSFNLTSSLMMLALALVWGGTFFFAEIALEQVPPLTITLIRVALATPFLLVVVWRKSIALPRSLRVWAAYFVMGALNNAIPFSLIFWGQTQIESGLAAILNGTTAMFGAVVAAMVFRDEPMTVNKLLGAVLGLGGVAYIMGFDALAGLDPTSLAQLAVLAATVSYACAGAWGRATLGGQSPMMNALGMLIGSTVIMVPIVLWVDGVPTFEYSIDVWAALLGLSVMSTALAYVLYFAVLARAGASNLLLVTLLIPPFAIMLGALFLGETMPSAAWVGFAIITLGFAVTDGRLFAKRARQ